MYVILIIYFYFEERNENIRIYTVLVPIFPNLKNVLKKNNKTIV